MAEPIGIASGVLALVGFAYQSSMTLLQTVKSFNSHQQRVRDLLHELSALSGVLNSLQASTGTIPNADFSTLEFPLLRCGSACQDFERLILRNTDRSSDGRTSFREWAKLRYMGDDIDGFRRLLASYKMTVNVALTHATLRQSSATAESIGAYHELLVDLILQRDVPKAGGDSEELTKMKEERESTEKCLQICADLSDYIDQVRLATKRNEQDSVAESITIRGLDECKAGLARTASKLQEHEDELFQSLVSRLRMGQSTEEGVKDLTRLREEWVATRNGMRICSEAHDQLKDDASTIDNYAVGDAVQFMVSTGEKTIHGRNRGLGWRTRQVGGHISDDTLKQIAQSLSVASISDSEVDNLHGPVRDTVPAQHFDAQYGKGMKLKSDTSVAQPTTKRNSPAESGSR